MNQRGRIPVLIALAVGLSLVVFGLLYGSSDDRAPAAVTGGVSDEPDGLGATDKGPSALESSVRETSPRTDSGGSLPPSAPQAETYLEATLTFASDGAAAEQARVGLWRAESGEGVSFRPARRLTELSTDAQGRVRFIAPPATPLELYARSADRGPTAHLKVGSLSAGETRAVRLNLERPPAPLEFHIVDSVSGDPVSGAAIRSVAFDQSQLGLEDFPGTTKLIQRTDGEGNVALPGQSRNARWLLVDAAGYSPTAIDPLTLEGRATAEVVLSAAAFLVIETVDATDQALGDVVITLQTSLGGYATTFTALSSRRGEATFRRLPSNIPLVPSAAAGNAVPSLFDAVTLEPGEKRALRLKLAGQ